MLGRTHRELILGNVLRRERHPEQADEHKTSRYKDTHTEIPHFTLLFTWIPNSFNCASLTGVGAFTIRSTARAVLGNGITSRKLSAPARIITIRSRPKAMPPCGGVPYSSASRKNPKRPRASSSLMPSAWKIFL